MSGAREAYCLMLYRDEATGSEEWLWNSRDGVTPFVISSPEGGHMKHVDWFRDVRAPFYIPPVGSRIFLDLTETRARALAARNAQRFYRHDPGIRKRYDSPEVLSELLWRDYLKPGAPDVLVVNSAMQDEFRARQPAPRKTRFA